MKKTALYFVGLFVALTIGYGLFSFRESVPMYPATQADIASVNENIIEIYKQNAGMFHSLSQVHLDYMRLGHYISGHDFRHPTDFCPECGLLEALSLTEHQLNERVIALSETNLGLTDTGKGNSDEYKQNVEEINRLMIEQTLVKKHLYSADERAKEVNMIMRDKRLIGNRGSVPNHSPHTVPQPKSK